METIFGYPVEFVDGLREDGMTGEYDPKHASNDDTFRGIWEGWDDGFREREESDSPYTIIRRVSRCPHCKGNLILNYSARGITFKHDDDRLLARFLWWAIAKLEGKDGR